MKFHLYTSRCATRQFEVADIDILRCALVNNSRFGLTGFLHRNRTHYFQYFEGPGERVQKLLCNLKSDKRHYEFQSVLSGEIPFPRFAGWSMGYSQFQLGDGAENKIRVSDSGEDILNYLLNESERQMQNLIAAEADVAAKRLLQA